MVVSVMRFPMPNHPCDVEIPDPWLADAGFETFKPIGSAFRSSSGAMLVPLVQVLPPHRNPAVTKDWRGFDHSRFVSVLKGIMADDEIEAVDGRALAEEEFPAAAYTHRVIDGFHRFYASVVAGFSDLPLVVR